MRVLMLLSTSSVTGPAELCLEDAKGLREAGHEVLFGFDTRRPGTYAEAIRQAGFEAMEELALCRKSPPWEVARDLARLRARMKHADLVHCRFSHDHALAMVTGKGLSRRPALVRSAEIAHAVRPGMWRGASFRACDAVIVPCESYKSQLCDVHQVSSDKVHVLPGRVNSSRFSPGDGAALRDELGVKGGEVLFGIVSRIKPERLHDVVVRAFARALSEVSGIRLAIVGRGEYEPAIRALVHDFNLDGRVLFAGYRTGDALVAAYRALDVKIWLAEGNDGTCRAVLEAMACGKPVIVGDGGALPEMVRDGADGFVTAPSEEGVAHAMVRLCDPAKREIMGRSARERAGEYTGNRRSAELFRVYEAAKAW